MFCPVYEYAMSFLHTCKHTEKTKEIDFVILIFVDLFCKFNSTTIGS